MNEPQLEEMIRFYVEASQCPDMQTYGSAFLEYFNGGLRFVRQMMRLGAMRNARVLDLGCGFGWYALLIAVLGKNNVVANDVRPLMIRNIQERLRAVEDKFGRHITVQPLCGDFITISLEPCSFDAVFCNQAIEHIHDLEGSFLKVRTLLKPGGVFVVANDNNRLTRKHLDEIEAMWQRRDSSWEFVTELKAERPEENRNIKPYAVMREEIIRRVQNELDDGAVEALVHATAGQVEHEIVDSVRAYLADGSLPTRPASSWCRNPITGEFCERQFDPLELKHLLRSLGFRVRLLQDIRRDGLLGWLGRIDLGWLHRPVFRYRSSFVLVAHKC